MIFDRAYVDYRYLNDLNQQGTFFVTRLKSQRGKQYRGKLRRISYNDPDTGKRLTFITNRFDLATQTVCDLYKTRWKVELFFRTLKQHLKIKKFLGTTSIPETMAVLTTMLLLKQPIMRLLGHLPRTTRYPPDCQLTLPL